MNSLKAILSGIIFIFVASMLMQLAYIFLAVGYNALAKDYPYLNEISGIFRYLVAIPVFLAIMFAGGYLTAVIANTKELIHSFIVGSTAIIAMMWMALSNADLTTRGIVINLLMLFFTVLGGWYWTHRNNKKN